jgi:hypothetical protein
VVGFANSPRSIAEVRLAKAVRGVLQMTEGSVDEHKFKVGQSVSYASGPFGRGGSNRVYTITQLLPLEGDDYQYRIKSANEPHERVVKESQLSRVA